MAYAEIETGLITTLRTITSYFPVAAQVATNSAVLDSGYPNVALIAPGSFGKENKGPAYVRTWDLMLTIYTAFSEEAASIANFKALRAAVILKIDETPNLGGVAGLYETDLVSDGDPYVSGPEPVYIAQNLRITAYQYLRVA